MSRFADPERTVTIELPCGCDPLPDGSLRHEQDVFVARVSLSHQEILRTQEGTLASRSLLLLVLTLKSWNLVDAHGKPVPCDAETISELDSETGSELIDKIGDAVAEARRLPNSSAGKSPASSRAKRSRTR